MTSPCARRSSRRPLLNREQLDAGLAAGHRELAARHEVADARLEQVERRVRDELARVGDLVAQLGRHHAASIRGVEATLAAHAETTAALATTTQSLREALASPKARGQWGERMAEDVLRLAGFVEHVNYEKQTAVAGRPRPARLHVPAAQGSRPVHGREVPAGRLPALPRRRYRRRARRPTATPSCATCACGCGSWPGASTPIRAPGPRSTTSCCSCPTRR